MGAPKNASKKSTARNSQPLARSQARFLVHLKSKQSKTDPDDAPAAKRQKTTPRDDDKSTPKEELMPPIPAVPPLATTERTNVRPSSIWWWGDKHNVPPPDPIYTPADTALWPEEAAELYMATKVNSDQKGASRYMRWWFSNHQGVPSRVPKIPRSAYALWEEVGQAWKALSKEEQQPYEEEIAILRERKEANEEWYDDRLEAWRKERRERLAKEGAELDPTTRRKKGLEPFCECGRCGPLDGEAAMEGAGGWSMH